jgi:hypothetical protein
METISEVMSYLGTCELSREDFAGIIRTLEARWARQKAFNTGRERLPSCWSMASSERQPSNWEMAHGEDGDGAAGPSYKGPRQQQTFQIDRRTWKQMGFKVHHRYAGRQLSSDERELFLRILDRSPGPKPGRPPEGEWPMSDKERQRRRRDKLKILATGAPNVGTGTRDHERSPDTVGAMAASEVTRDKRSA